MPCTTGTMSAPTRSANRASSLAKEILSARNELLPYLIISALVQSVLTIGTPGAPITCATRAIASVSSPPTTCRAASCMSRSADPSRRNSGHETTGSRNGGPPSCSCTMRAVPGGTVLFTTTTVPGLAWARSPVTTEATALRSGWSSAAWGVPTVMKAMRVASRACPRSPVTSNVASRSPCPSTESTPAS